jgi:ABC-type hemin transport system ATPase subunit
MIPGHFQLVLTICWSMVAMRVVSFLHDMNGQSQYVDMVLIFFFFVMLKVDVS